MRVEMNHRELTVRSVVSTHQWQGDVVIATETQRGFAGRKQRIVVLIDAVTKGFVATRGKFEITVIGESNAVEYRKVPGPAFLFPTLIGASLADCGWAAACASSACGCQVVWQAYNEYISVVGIAAQWRTHVAEYIGVHGKAVTEVIVGHVCLL